ncbi:MAG: chromosome segregation protein SMC [Oscillospiraceae bacterium]|nr:chromosome segregation protein SMC [Oscillospiraceae bacterium]
MHLKSLELQGFKSFPDKTSLSFGKGMTAVVGPNGSGKSNISDAIHWVLGEQSSKSLRGSKMEDVVFSGTSTRRAQGFAEVSLKLDNKDKALASDGDEITVTRRYYRSGESEYLLNGTGVRLKDVLELFMDTGLGRDGYSMVGQGRIEDMVSAKSSGRRDMLEEAAGIAHYRYRRGEAERKLRQSEENLVRLRDIWTELESRVVPLFEQSEKAKKFLGLANERKELEIGLWLHTLDRSADTIRGQSNKIALAQSEYAKINDELDGIFEDIENSSSEIKNRTLKIEEIQNDGKLYEEKAAAIDALSAVDMNSIGHNSETVRRIKEDKASETDIEKHLDERIAEAQTGIKLLEKEIAGGETELGKAAKELESVKAEDSGYTEKAAILSSGLSELSLELSRQKIAASSALSSVREIRERLSAVGENRKHRLSEIEGLEKEKAETEKTVSELNEIVTENKNAVAGYNLRISNKSAKLQKQKEELDALNMKLSNKRSRLKMLDEMEKNMEGYSGSVKAVMREAKRGNLRGIHGALSQLISVDGKYSTAIETAMGAAIQNIVTDNENDAKRAIGFLKDTNAGRATFLPLSSIRANPLRENGLENCEGYIDAALNLVGCDAKYRDALSSVLGRTAVADSLDSAIAISRKFGSRFRIVTLDGQVINAGGSMTGGTRVQSSGFLSRANETEKLHADIKELDEIIKGRAGEYKTASEELAAEKAAGSGAAAELARAEEEKINKEAGLNLVSGKLKHALELLAELENEAEGAEARIKAFTESGEMAEEEIKRLEIEISEKEKSLSEITGSRDALTEKRERFGGIMNAANLKIAEAKKDISSKRENIESFNRRKSSHSDRQRDLDVQIAALLEKNAELTLRIEKNKEEAAALRKQCESTVARTAELVKTREGFEKRVSDLRLSERGKNADRETMSGELVRLEERLLALRTEQDETERKLYEEYQMTRREAKKLEITIESPSKANKRLSALKTEIKNLGNVNVGAIEEYKEVAERYEFMKAQITDIESSVTELNRLIEELTGKMAGRFREQFIKINHCFGESFNRLFGGGRAELILEDENDILECGIEIKAQPPGKNVKNLTLLSGGEKGLCAIAMLFAILKVKPAPFCVFDEVEAALDDVNVGRYAAYVRSMTKNSQFILITHRRGTMEEADVMYGVTMQEEGVSKLLELKTAELAGKLGIR